MSIAEERYVRLLREVYTLGTPCEGRNGLTRNVFGLMLKFKDAPLFVYRKMYYKGILGELAALLRQPKHIDDFKKWGCNYWDQWGDEQGNIRVDYGNLWFDFNGFNQIAALKDQLQHNPASRRMIVTGWRPDTLHELSLPCCHYSYQFGVVGETLNLLWTQRSVDMAIGLPADMLLAWTLLQIVANEFGYAPGEITMSLGDCHIYDEHNAGVVRYLHHASTEVLHAPDVTLLAPVGTDFTLFEPDWIEVNGYESCPPIKFELKV